MGTGARALPRPLRAAFLAGLLTASIAAGPSTRAEGEGAWRQHHEEGLRAARAGLWEKARGELLAAFKIEKRREIATSLGRAELKTGRHRDAAEHLAWSLDQPGGGHPEERVSALEMLATARAKVAELTVSADRPDAEIFLDEQPLGKTPLARTVFVEPGIHLLSARLDERTSARELRDFGAGSRVSVALTLAAEPRDAAAPSREVGWTAGEKAVVVVGTTVTAAALGIGIGAALVSQEKADERGPKPPSCPPGCAYDALEQERISAERVAIVGFAAAGALGAATLTYALLGAARPKRARVVVAPAPIRRGALLVVTSTF